MAAAEHNLPTRTNTELTDDEAVPGEDTSETTRLFSERLKAWRNAVTYLENYVEATEKMQHAHGKEYEKVLKTVSHPLKHGEHFDQSLGGVAGMFDNIRGNTQGISNSHYETAKVLKGSVLPIFSRLNSELKHKSKELVKGAGKGSKAVDKARASTQKHIELLSQHTGTFDSTGGKVDAANDPYVLQRGIMHRLNRQVIEENNNRQDLIAVQDSFAQFEAHVITTFQSGLGQFVQVVNSQQDKTKQMYGDMVGTAQRIPPDFEWNGFIKRNSGVLIDPSAPARSVSNIGFANQNHKSTQPLIAGSLQRKGKVLKSYDTFYYVVTPSKYLHEFKTDDDFAKDPVPENSFYLPDCLVGGLDGAKFNIKGKDLSKGKLGNKFSMSHEMTFKAHTPQDAQQWWEIIRSVAGQVTNELPDASAPSSPADSRKNTMPLQTEGLETGTIAPAGSAPMSAGTTGVPGSAVEGPKSAYDYAPGSAIEPNVAGSVPGSVPGSAIEPTSAGVLPGTSHTTNHATTGHHGAL